VNKESFFAKNQWFFGEAVSAERDFESPFAWGMRSHSFKARNHSVSSELPGQRNVSRSFKALF
jgi:hypothetical protein